MGATDDDRRNDPSIEVNVKSFKDRYYRPDEIADVLNVARSTVYRMIRDIADPLPAYRINDKGPLRVHGKDINKYLVSHKVRPEYE
ncbi:MAG TPA: helix-turn-helix domain-containing protein [Candidatus Cloacimonadota bacterium]|nr:helix-turn-helix domain-containing protein [Candidatus Cloacimonadota bacterium]HPL23760.1 helix-turn-helix domain-containing protein [Candidatus Cloacimonadota bacterium]